MSDPTELEIVGDIDYVESLQGIPTPNLTQVQVEDSSSTSFGSVSGQRIWQAIIKWWETAAPASLSQAQVEDSSSVVFGLISGQRIWQAITAWGATAASIFSGILKAYKEQGTTLTVTAGATSVVHATCDNILKLPALTQDTVITFTGTVTAEKPITIKTIADTGGPWTLSYIANSKTKLLTRNGSGTAKESFELEGDADGDLYTIDAGGTVWSTGT